jgi:hypothetical protein
MFDRGGKVAAIRGAAAGTGVVELAGIDEL